MSDSSGSTDKSYPKRSYHARSNHEEVTVRSAPTKHFGRMNDWHRTLVDTAFTDDIPLIDIPSHFFAPKLIIYDGMADPGDRIIHYRHTMIPTCIPNAKRDEVICKVFTFNLRGLALLWFNSLPECSIDSFNTLAKIFKQTV